MLDGGDIDFSHSHHCIERTFCLGAPSRKSVSQRTWRYLPRYSPAVFAPAARALLSSIADDGIPISVCFFLIVRRDLERKCLTLLEGRAAIEAHTRNPADGELDRQHITFLAVREIRGCMKNGAHIAVWKSSGVKFCCFM